MNDEVRKLTEALKGLLTGLMMDYPIEAIGMNNWPPVVAARAALAAQVVDDANAANAAAREGKADTGDWPEDFATENGNYSKLTTERDDARKNAEDHERNALMFAKAWSRELGPRRHKTHLIDELVVATRELVEAKNKAETALASRPAQQPATLGVEAALVPIQRMHFANQCEACLRIATYVGDTLAALRQPGGGA